MFRVLRFWSWGQHLGNWIRNWISGVGDPEFLFLFVWLRQILPHVRPYPGGGFLVQCFLFSAGAASSESALDWMGPAGDPGRSASSWSSRWGPHLLFSYRGEGAVLPRKVQKCRMQQHHALIAGAFLSASSVQVLSVLSQEDMRPRTQLEPVARPGLPHLQTVMHNSRSQSYIPHGDSGDLSPLCFMTWKCECWIERSHEEIRGANSGFAAERCRR